MSASATDVVTGYIEAWRKKDFPSMRAAVADGLDFAGPIDTFDNADAHHQAIQGLSQMLKDIVVQKVWTDGGDVLVWYDLHTQMAGPAPVAEWYQVKAGKIAAIRVVFDARAFAPPA